MTATKAIYGAVLGFVAPGAAYLLLNLDGGLTWNELLGALLTAVVTSASVGVAVHRVENKPK